MTFTPIGWCYRCLADTQELGADTCFYSLYKAYGPHLGVMHLEESLNQALPNQEHYFNQDKAAYRFTPAGPDRAQIAAVNGVLDYLESIYAHHTEAPAAPAEQARTVNELFRAHEQTLLQPLLDYLDQHKNVRLIGRTDASTRASTVAFTCDGLSSADIAQQLADKGFGVGVGDFYARRLVETLGIDPADGAVRLSFVHYTHADEVQALMTALAAILPDAQ